MSRKGAKRIDKFLGVRTDAAKPALKPEEFSVDEGTERFEQERIRRRAGTRHANVDKFDGAITAQLGFDMPGPVFGYIVVAGIEVWGIRQIGVL